ncbi:MAG: hypothetical protein ABEN55_03770 [Bradymonadaceae bacterium]
MRRDINHDIDSIIVDPEDIKQAIRRNHERQRQGRWVIRINPPFEGCLKGSLHLSEQGARYPNKPAPIHIYPEAFLSGKRAEPHDIPEAAQYPNVTDVMDECRKDLGLDDDKRLPEVWKQWWQNALEVWKGEVERHLVDELDMSNKSVRIQYKEGNHGNE